MLTLFRAVCTICIIYLVQAVPFTVIEVPLQNTNVKYGSSEDYLVTIQDGQIIDPDLTVIDLFNLYADSTTFEVQQDPNNFDPTCEPRVEVTGTVMHSERCAFEDALGNSTSEFSFIMTLFDPNITTNECSASALSRSCVGGFIESEPFVAYAGDETYFRHTTQSTRIASDNYYELFAVLINASNDQVVFYSTGSRGLYSFEDEYVSFPMISTDGLYYIRVFFSSYLYDATDAVLSVSSSFHGVFVQSIYPRTDQPTMSPTLLPTISPTLLPSQAPSTSPSILICQPGTFKNMSFCDPCPINTFANVSGLVGECYPCPYSQHTAFTVGNTQCFPPQICDPGRYWDLNLLECISCPVDTFTEVSGTIGECTACPNDRTTNGAVGATSCALITTLAPTFSTTLPPVATPECNDLKTAAETLGELEYAAFLKNAIDTDDFATVDCLHQLFTHQITQQSELYPRSQWGVDARDIFVNKTIFTTSNDEVELGARARVLQYELNESSPSLEAICLCDDDLALSCFKQLYFTLETPLPEIALYFGVAPVFFSYKNGEIVECSSDSVLVETDVLLNQFARRRQRARQLQGNDGDLPPVYGSFGPDVIPTASPTTADSPSESPSALPTALPTTRSPTALPSTLPTALPTTPSPTALPTTRSPTTRSPTTMQSPTAITTPQPTLANPASSDFVSSPGGIATFVIVGVICFAFLVYVVRKFYLIRLETKRINALYDNADSSLQENIRRFLFD